MSPLLSNCKFVFGLVWSCLPSGSVCLACLAFAPPRPSMSPCASDWWGWEVVASSNTPLARSHTLLMNFLCRHTSLLLGIFVFGSFLKLRAFYDAVRDPTSALRSAPVGPRAPVRKFVHQPLLPPVGAPVGWAEIQLLALIGSSRSLRSEACNALGAADGVIHSNSSSC